MEPVSIGLMLFLLCGQPVGVVASLPKADGTREIIAGPVDGAQRAWWIAEAARIEKLKDGLVIRIPVEKQVEGIRCPTHASSTNEMPPLYMKPRYPIVRNDDEDATAACETRRGCWF